MSITCQVCGTVNPDGTQFCEGCGVELKSQAAAAPVNSVSPDSVSLPDLTPPNMPAAPSIPAAPVMPAPRLDTQASVPAELDTPASAVVLEAIPSEPVSAGPAEEVPAPIASDALPAAPSDVQVSELAASDVPASDVLVSDVAVGEVAPALNPDLTSAGDAPLMEDAPLETPAPEAAPAGPVISTATPDTTPTAAPRTGEAKLGVKKFGTATGDFIPLQGEKLMVGRFDASSGPVDIDLSSLPGAEHISRHHAELYREGGTWFVRDLGSTNGVFVRKGGQSAFSPRLQEPTPLADGDELAFGNLMLTFHQDA